jgi:uncharacterized protein YcbX
VYPIKSCHGIPVSSVRIVETGIERDREWMIVDTENQFVTQRQIPAMANIRPRLGQKSMTIGFKDWTDEVSLPLDEIGEPVTVQVWRDECAACESSPAASEFVSMALSRNVKLVRRVHTDKRFVSDRNAPQWGRHACLSFADAFPILAVFKESFDDFNSYLSAPVPINRFRPNIVFCGLDPYADDNVTIMRGQSIELERMCARTRCQMTNVDQESGVSFNDVLPLLTARRHDRNLRGVTFGQALGIRAGVGAILSIADVFSIPACRREA